MTSKHETDADLTRKGTRRNVGADSPSGPNTERTTVPARREAGGANPSDIMPGAHPDTVREIEKERRVAGPDS